jgi:hypothetical protein
VVCFLGGYSISFFSVLSASSNVQPKSGLLHEYMEKAKQEIKLLKMEAVETQSLTH